MAAQLHDDGYFARASKFRRAPMSEINVTPFVDVMLVLLIIFMVTAPLLTVGVPVDLPKTKAATMSGSEEPLVVTIDKNGTVFIQQKAVEMVQLVPRLHAVTGANPSTKIFVRGDKAIQYGMVMSVMGEISAAGFTKVSLLAELPMSRKKRKK
jgi:biopolymer transport protein TolR